MAKKQIKKPRITKVEGVIPAGYDVVKGLTFNVSADSVELIDGSSNIIDSEELIVSTSYKKKRKDKIINKLTNCNLGSSINSSVLSFDEIYAIDTNTKVLGDKVIHCGVLCKVDVTENDGVEVSGKLKFIKEFIWDIGKRIEYPEQHAWYHAIDNINSDKESISKAIALIVDCDLGNLDKYNDKSLPYYDDFYVPSNISLIYASADVGSEFVPNKAIRYSDKMATKYLNSYIEGTY